MSNTQDFVQTTHRRGFITTGATTGTLHPMQGQQEQQHSWSSSNHLSGLHFGAIESRSRESLEEDWQMLKRQGQGGTPASRNTPDVPPRDGERQRQPWRSWYNKHKPAPKTRYRLWRRTSHRPVPAKQLLRYNEE